MSEATKSFWATPQPGDELPVVLDRYRVLGVLGEGGMGTVVKAFHLQLKRYVAIKTVRVEGAERPQLVARFVREMEAVGQMDHPNVVRAFDAGEKNGVFYLVMEFLDGADLDRLVARRGPVGTADACELTRQTALGLAYAHEKLIHRDVKPSNLMLTTAGLVKVLDLGLARFADVQGGERTPEGYAVGTHDYVAPEQVAGGSLDGRADVYSLGCALFKLLTGRPPYSGPTFDTVAKKLFAHCHIPLHDAPGFQAIPPDLAAVLLRMTAKDPAERCPALVAAQALTPFTAGSNLARLLGDGQRGDGPAIQALPRHLPESLSRLTEYPRETPLNTRGAQAPATPVPVGRRLRVLRTAGILAAILAVPAYFLVPALLSWFGPSRTDDGQPVHLIVADRFGAVAAGPRPLDGLAAQTHHLLLDQSPFPMAGAAEDGRNWRWDEKQQLLDVKGHDDMLFNLGTTARTRFDFEVGIAQAPWVGRVGIFWGFHEDSAAKKARLPNTDFGEFQMILIWRRAGDNGEALYSVRRGTGVLGYGQRREPLLKPKYSHRHDLPIAALVGGEKILRASFDQNRLRRAWLGSHELAGLTTDAANQTFAGQPYDGGLGVLSLSYAATFDKVRYFGR